MPLRGADSEAGFTMIMTMIGLSLIAMLVMIAVTAVNGDVHQNAYDLSRKQAFEAAKSGIDDYAYHLHKDNGYWARCTDVAEPHAVNQEGAIESTRTVPGSTGARYAIELIPASGQEECDSSDIVTATNTMIESLGSFKGTFRIRSTGYAGEAEISIVATFKPASFLDYVYFTQLETSDPVTYGSEQTIKGAYEQCSKTIADGRTEQPIPGTSQYCRTISFVGGDEINGPLHTNDALVVCQSPRFGRTPSDPVEVSAPAEKGWYSTNDPILHAGSWCSGSPNFVGTFQTNSPVLIPPSNNSKLATIAEPAFRFNGQVRICLSGDSMTVSRTGTNCDGEVLYTGPIPANGVVYVENGICNGEYTPFEVTYPESSECGNVYVRGSYTGQLTIAAGNDIVINGDLDNDAEEGLLGLIANNFIRVYHPMTEDSDGDVNCQNASGYTYDLEIDAAILAINHSFIVDNYNCGNSLGTLNVLGAISQKYRGAVGTTGGTGYLKNYVYDDRLHTIQPPSFLEPVQSDWVIGRETVD
jgi:type II secretory pathway pseudopilin PulG